MNKLFERFGYMYKKIIIILMCTFCLGCSISKINGEKSWDFSFMRISNNNKVEVQSFTVVGMEIITVNTSGLPSIRLGFIRGSSCSSPIIDDGSKTADINLTTNIKTTSGGNPSIGDSLTIGKINKEEIPLSIMLKNQGNSDSVVLKNQGR